jgi:hypothetical protein
MFYVMQMQALKKEIAELRQEMKAMKDEQIKKRRNDEDLMFNLDGDNIPTLQGIVKRVDLVVNGDGTANAELIIEAINGQSKAQIRADRIDLTGAEINLTADNIKITGTNFTVDKNGNLTCKGAKLNTATINDATMNRATMNQANIKSNCILMSDLQKDGEEGVAMQFGPNVEFTLDNGRKTVSGTTLRVTATEDVTAGATYTRGIAFVSAVSRYSGESESSGGLLADVNCSGAFAREGEGFQNYQAFAGVERTPDGRQLAVLRVGSNMLWVDEDGAHCTGKLDEEAYPY